MAALAVKVLERLVLFTQGGQGHFDFSERLVFRRQGVDARRQVCQAELANAAKRHQEEAQTHQQADQPDGQWGSMELLEGTRAGFAIRFR